MTIWRWVGRILWVAAGLLGVLWLLGGLAAPRYRPGYPLYTKLLQGWEHVAWYEEPLRWLGTRHEGDGFWAYTALVTALVMSPCLALGMWHASGRKRPWRSGACAAMSMPLWFAMLLLILGFLGYVD
jgi:hypothetical protein